MSRLERRVERLEGGSRECRPRVLPFPPEDGETAEDIERRLAEWKARGPMSEAEWVAKSGAEDCRGFRP